MQVCAFSREISRLSTHKFPVSNMSTNVDLAELKDKLEELKPDVDFLTVAEAQDYHQSLLINQEKIREDNTVNRKLPEEI